MQVTSEVPPVLIDALRPGVPAVKTELRYAGFLFRALALLIDYALLGGGALVIASSVRVIAPTDFQAIANIVPVTSVIAWAYFTLLESSPAQATVGKFALGLVVTDAHGDPIGFPRAAFRYLMKSLSTLLLLTGWALAAFTPRKQALHDLFAGTVVLRKVHYLVPENAAPAEAGEHWDGIRWVAAASPLEKS